jgi:DNA polymerase I
MSERLVVIDGMSVFYRGFYALPNLTTKDGMPTGGVYGFAVMALEIIKRLQPEYVAVAWDKRHTNARARTALYPPYKAQRKPAPEGFYDQVAILHQLLQTLGWPLYELDDYEADDIMATFATQAKAKGIETYLVTSDLDVLQLVNSHTHIYTLKKGLSNIELFNEAHFEEKYGVGAHQWIDVKALKGDASDNIPGVAGVGEKTALELIDTYETLDGVYAHLDELKPALRAKLEKDKDMAYLSKKLVTLFVDAPLILDFGAAKRTDGVAPEFVAMLRKLEFRVLLRQVEAQVGQLEGGEAHPEERALLPAKQITYQASDYQTDRPRVVALSPEATDIWVSLQPDEYAVVPIEQSAAAVSGPLIGHDLKAVYRALLARDMSAVDVTAHDTRIGSFLLNSLQRALELSDLLEQTIPPDDAGMTVTAIWHLYTAQYEEFEQLPQVRKLATEIEFPMVALLAAIEHRGIVLDSDMLQKMSVEFEHKIATLEKEIYKSAGQDFNISSPAQLGMILYEKLGLPTQGVKKGKTGYSTGATELDKLRQLHPIVNMITEYREYTKLKSTYIDALPRLVDHEGRLHTTFALDVAATGRLSSRDPNLQNIPTRTELGQAIRTAFVPAAGNVFVSADYSQFELRLAAYMAGDRQMIEDFNKDIDIHTATAAQVYGVPLTMVTKEMRRRAKAVNFGILYGMSPHGLSVATGMTPAEAKKFIEKYFALRQPLQQYMNDTAELALQRGYVETIFGRRRPTPDMKSSNWIVREAAKRAAINMPIQGSEADLVKMAMLQVEKALDGLGKQILQIHDSILVETPKANAGSVAQLLKDTMERVHALPVKLAVDVKVGRNWGEL